MPKTFTKNRLNYLFPFSLDIKPPIMLIFLALLAADECVAVKLAADRSVEHHDVAKYRCMLLDRPKRPEAQRLWLSIVNYVCGLAPEKCNGFSYTAFDSGVPQNPSYLTF
jgi:hypothetical protein